MFGRRRRLGLLLGAVVVALVVGRFGALFLTDRLWEARISEAAALVGTRFALMRAGLEVAGLGLGIAWFLLNFLAATAAVIREFGDLPRPLGHLTERSVVWVVVGVSVVLGVTVAGGTGQWLDELLLVINGVTYGVTDPLLDQDLGLFVADLPVWELIHERAIALVLPALIGVTVIATMGGTFQLADRRLSLAPRVRRHFALLLGSLAVVLAMGFLLTPFRLAAAASATLGPAEFLLRSTVARIEAGFALTAALLSVLWGFRARFVVALGGWVGLGLAALSLAALVQSRAGGPLGTPELRRLRRVDSIAFGIGGPAAAPGTLASLGPSLWDPDALTRITETDSAEVVQVLPGTLDLGDRPARVWFVLRDLSGGDVSVLAIADDRTGPTGGPVSVRWGDSLYSPGLVPYLTLSRTSIRPGAPAWVFNAGPAGVLLSGPIRRIAVAWALQAGEVLRAAPTQRFAWRLEPDERLRALVPFADWSRPRARIVDRDILWVADGFLSAARFPASHEATWRGRDLRMLRAGFIGVVEARGGETRVFLRPDADSLAAAWARIAAPLIEPASALPAAVREQIGLPREQLAVQAQVMQGPAWIGRPAARYGRGFYPVEDLSALGTSLDVLTAPFVDGENGQIVGLLAGPVRPRTLTTAFHAVDSALAVPGIRDLQQYWDRFPFFQQLRDSIRAAGAEFEHGLIRFGLEGDTLLAYQPSYSLGPGGRTTLVLVNVALGPRRGAGRTLDEAWRNLRGEVSPSPIGTEVGARLEQARLWLDRADLALKRGDLEEFGRAFGFLRELLRADRAEPPPPER